MTTTLLTILLHGRVAARLQGLAASGDVVQNLTDQGVLPFQRGPGNHRGIVRAKICRWDRKTKAGITSLRFQHSKDVFVCSHAARNDQGWHHPGTRRMVGQKRRHRMICAVSETIGNSLLQAGGKIIQRCVVRSTKLDQTVE